MKPQILPFCAAAAAIAFSAASCATKTDAPLPSVSSETAGEEATDGPKPAEEKPAEPSAADKFRAMTAGLYAESIRISSAPRETVRGKPFQSPYEISVHDSDGNAVAGLSLSVRWPVSRTAGADGRKSDGLFETAESVVVTDGEGRAEFTPPPPETSLSAELSVMPAFDADGPDAEEIGRIAARFRTSAPIVVRTDQLSAGGLISLVEFREDGTPIRGDSLASSKLLTAMMRQRFTGIGNADLTDAVVSGDSAKVKAAADRLLSGGTGRMAFLVYGTVRPAKTADGHSFTIDVRCMRLSDGGEIYSTTQSGTGKTASEARISAANAVAARLVNGL